jgi:uncharacterized membrane protein YraQ (UPF0718 family)
LIIEYSSNYLIGRKSVVAHLPEIEIHVREEGMAPGVAMAFLVGGGATSIPAALAVYGIARGRVFAVYVALATIGALLTGIAYQAFAG